MRPLISTILGVLLVASTTINAAPVIRRDPGIWTPVGTNNCWSDNTQNVRALGHALGGFDDLTPAKCQNLCDAAGFVLAGVEYGRECYCGNTIFGLNRPSATGICTMPCAGNANQNCGGPNAINIYVKDGSPFTIGPAALDPGQQDYENPQCYVDTVGDRILTGLPAFNIPPDLMTVGTCIAGCKAANFASAGLEFGRECYCGNTGSPAAQTAVISDCNMPCQGDASQYCGGPSRLLLYHNPQIGSNSPPSPEPTPTGQWAPAQGGCWTDNVQNQRALEHFAGGFDDLTPAKCQVLCETAGYSLAGTEFGRECFCGNRIVGLNAPASNGICNMSCAGAPNKICGGPNAINIYVKDGFDYASGPARVLDSYNGYSKTQCWQDSTANRILKHGPAAPIPGESMTVEKCIDGCAAAGYSSAGVEYGGECFCDNVSYPPGPSGSMDECNMPCNGNGNEICGGASRILIYYKSPITATTTSTDSITPSVPTTTTTSTTTAPTETSTTSSLLQSETLIPSSTIPSTPSETPTPTFGATHEGLIEILSATTNAHIGYLAGIEDSGLVSFQRDVNLAKVYAFQVPEGGATTVTQTQIADTTSEGWFPLLGLIDGYGNPEPNIGTGSPNYLFLGGTSPSNPGEIPQYGPSSYDPEMSMFLAFESSVWSINMVTGDITPRWVNEDGIPVQTDLFAFLDRYILGTGDFSVTFSQLGEPDSAIPIKMRFVAQP